MSWARGTLTRIVALSSATTCLSGCVVRAAYSSRRASGGVVSTGVEAADERGLTAGGQFGLAVHDQAYGTAVSIRGDVHVGLSTIRDILEMRKLEWAASVFAGIDWTRGHDRDEAYRDITFPVGAGLTFIMPIGDNALSLQPRYNFHLGDESPDDRRHELLLSVGFHFAPPLTYESKN